MDFIISRRLSSDRLYAYCKKRFWIWNDARCVWKESHLMSQKYERADAPTGCSYVAPLLTRAWFRWATCRDSGQYLTGAEVSDRRPTNVQIFHNGEWHPVAAFYGSVCAPASDYFQEVGA